METGVMETEAMEAEVIPRIFRHIFSSIIMTTIFNRQFSFLTGNFQKTVNRKTNEDVFCRHPVCGGRTPAADGGDNYIMKHPACRGGRTRGRVCNDLS